VLRTRLSTAIVVLPATIAIVLFAPPAVFTGFIAILTVWGLYEIVAMTKANALEMLVIAIAGGVPAIMLLLNAHLGILAPLVLATIVAMLMLVAYVAREGAELVPHGQWFVALGALWVGALFPYFALLRNYRDGIPVIILMLLLVVASDSGAYFVGRSLGRTKLVTRVSPNKTVEGAIGGLGACITAAIILRPLLTPQWRIGAVVILATAVGLLAQLGDLAGSAYKRVAGVKDSGWLFPGHGGLLDRTCSLVFAATFTYYCLRH
jgi:phosphatidate cytidylyltransferase